MPDDCPHCAPATTDADPAPDLSASLLHVAVLGNPNTGKTTLFNRLCGLRHKTSNFPGTTQEARLGTVRLGSSESAAIRLIDLPGIYSLALEQTEAEICREVMTGHLAPKGEPLGTPDAVLVVADATNLPRNLVFVGEILAQRLPTVIALNMSDLARRSGLKIDAKALEERLGCRVIPCSARSGDGLDEVSLALRSARIPNRTPPGERAALEEWAEQVYLAGVVHPPGANSAAFAARADLTDRLDRVFTHPLVGLVVFHAVMAALFFVIFKIATYPMDWIDAIFAGNGDWVAPWQPQWLATLVGGGLTGLVEHLMPEGILRDLLAHGVVGAIGATVIFVPQIALLFFLISLLEDTGYLARAAFVMDRILRPFGLPGYSFVPLLSSHACALPGIVSARAIPDRRDRLATILVAPFMTCSARIPVYVLVTSILFRDRPGLAALAFIGCYALGTGAGLLSAMIARRTILPGKSSAMALELPTYKLPSIRTAFLTAYDRSLGFLKNAGTNILAICVVLWWLGAFPRVGPPDRAVELRAQASAIAESEPATTAEASAAGDRAQLLITEAEHLEAAHAKAESYAGRMGRFIQPVFEPLGYDWQLTVGVLTSFAAREVFVSTMAVIVTGSEDTDDEGVFEQIRSAPRSDGVTPIFTPATCWSILVFYVLAMQCLPTLVLTAREAGGIRWAILQLAWMTIIAYIAAFIAYRLANAVAGS